ncbi:MAG: NAD(P)H-dependent oxidoreductase [Cyanothece sp. SIO1E1]|nr:NAD(P)H-dependent oxidoreductase [Cyanothece sp. SIO1E1]
MPKLVIITHPDLSTSTVNKLWLEELQKFPNEYVIHSLYNKYPKLDFDIEAEQALLSKYSEIIFQFPIHWFSIPFALKKYIDEVFSYGWAFGPGGDKLAGKRIGFAVSTGGMETSYSAGEGIPVATLLNDVALSFKYCGCEIAHLHVFHGAMFAPTRQALVENARVYVQSFLTEMSTASS